MKKFILMVLLGLSASLSHASDVTLAIEKQNDNTLKVSFSSPENAAATTKVSFNVFYSGDNYPVPVALYNKKSWIGVTPGSKGSVILDNEFITDEWIPSIQKYVENPKIWLEYTVGGESPVKSNIIQ